MTTDIIYFLDFIREIGAQHGLLAFLFIVLIQTIFAILLLPCSQFTLLAGVVFGAFEGSVAAVIGAFVSTASTFLIARYFKSSPLFERLLKNRMGLKFRKILDKNIQGRWSDVLFLHTNPMVPGASMGYVFGLTNTPTAPFLLKILISSIPNSIILAVVAAEAVNIPVIEQTKNIYIPIILILCGIVFMWKIYPAFIRWARNRTS